MNRDGRDGVRVDVFRDVAAEPLDVGSHRSKSAQGRGVLEGAFLLLEQLAGAAGGLGLSEIARDSQLPKASAYRLLEQLVELGAVERHDRRYLVGRRLALLGTAWRPDPVLDCAAREPALLLSKLTSTATCVCVLHDNKVRVVTGTRGLVTEIPRLRPFDEFSTKTAVGRVLLLGSRASGDEPPAGFTLAEWQRSRAAFRRSGAIVVDEQEILPGLSCVAVPVRGLEGELVAAVGALVVRPVVPAGLAELVVRASREISNNLARMMPVH